MCHLLVAVKKEAKENEEMTYLTNLQIEELKTQKDGCSAIAIAEDGEFEVKRSLRDYDSVFDFIQDRYETSKLFAIHTRIASSGGVSEDNVHFFEDKGVYIAHNGWLLRSYPVYNSTPRIGFDKNGPDAKKGRELMEELDRHYKVLESCKECSWEEHREYKTCKKHRGEKTRIVRIVDEINDVLADIYGTDDSYPSTRPWKNDNNEVDTLTFLKAIERPLTKDSIEKAVRTTQFKGMAFMYDSTNGKAWVAIKEKTVYCAVRDGYVEIFSYDPTLGGTELKEDVVFGLPVEYKRNYDVMSKDELSHIEDGVFEIEYGYKPKKK